MAEALAAPGLSILEEMTSLGPQARPEDLTDSQLRELRELFSDHSGLGLYCFARYICNAKDLYAPLHLEIAAFLSKWGQLELGPGEGVPGNTTVCRPPGEDDNILKSWRRLHLCIPRDHFKTTLGTIANALWTATLDPEVTIGIFNESEEKSKLWVGTIKQIIQGSRLYHLLWPEVLPPGLHFRERLAGKTIPRTWKWGDTGCVLNRESVGVSQLTFMPYGIGGSPTGQHFTHKILDDIIGEKSGGSPAVMEDAVHFVDHARELERPAQGGCELVNYTRWAYHDVYAHMLQKWPGDYQVYLRSVLENTNREPDIVSGKAIFPKRINTAQARKMYDTDPFVFSSQYMCIPMAGREVSFDRRWLRYGAIEPADREPTFVIEPEHYNPRLMHSDLQDVEFDPAPNSVPLAWMNKAIILDPAPSKSSERRAEPRARNGLLVVGKDAWNRNYHLEGLALREDPVSVLYQIITLAQRWRTLRVGIEEVCFSALYAPLWNRIVYHEFPDMHIEWCPLRPEGFDKDTRILAMVPPMREGFWYFDRSRSGYIVQELLEYPHCQTKDLVDALAYTEKILSRPETPNEWGFSKWRAATRDTGRCSVTGY